MHSKGSQELMRASAHESSPLDMCTIEGSETVLRGLGRGEGRRACDKREEGVTWIFDLFDYIGNRSFVPAGVVRVHKHIHLGTHVRQLALLPNRARDRSLAH
jgi:hypothetical protein